MKHIILAAVLLIATPAIATTDSSRKACELAAAQNTSPTEQSPCVWGESPSVQCQRFINKWVAVMARERARCTAEKGKS
jgi:hypothetical protein